MGAYKQFLASDIVVTPFTVNKSFTFQGIAALTGSNVGIERLLGQNITSSLFSSASSTPAISIGNGSSMIILFMSLNSNPLGLFLVSLLSL